MPREVRAVRSSLGVVAYVRGSPSASPSESTQRRSIREWARREKRVVLGWHVESAEASSTVDERTAIMEALVSVAAAGAKVLCVAAPSSMDREGYARAVVERLAHYVGARVVYVSAGGAEDGLSSEVRSALIAHEWMLLRLRTMMAAELKRPRGALWGCCPWGYRFSPDGMRLEPFEAEQNVIDFVRQMRLRGMKLREIADELRRSGVVGRTGKPLGITRIFELLDEGRGSRPQVLRN